MTATSARTAPIHPSASPLPPSGSTSKRVSIHVGQKRVITANVPATTARPISIRALSICFPFVGLRLGAEPHGSDGSRPLEASDQTGSASGLDAGVLAVAPHRAGV